MLVCKKYYCPKGIISCCKDCDKLCERKCDKIADGIKVNFRECSFDFIAVSVQELLDNIINLENQFESCIDGLKRMRGNGWEKGIEFDTRFSVQLLYKTYQELQMKIKNEKEKIVVFVDITQIVTKTEM